MTRMQRSTSLCVAAGLLAATTSLSGQRGPAMGVTHLPADVLALACAPKAAYEEPLASLRITGGQDSFIRHSYAPGDLVTINAGSINGIEIGQQYYVRRLQVEPRQPVSRDTPTTIRTTGWIRVWAVDIDMSLATIEYACDTIDVGDFLEPFVLPFVPKPDATLVKTQRSNYGRILLGTDRRQSFAKGDLFIIDRGSDHGVTVGARFVVYRDKGPAEYRGSAQTMYNRQTVNRDKEQFDNFLYELGEAAAVDVRPEDSTVQAILSRDEFHTGDYVALRK